MFCDCSERWLWWTWRLVFIEFSDNFHLICHFYDIILGGFIKPIALSNVRIIYNLLLSYNRLDIDIIGVGGIFTGRDVFELILCGAKAVQIGTCHWTEGSVCFERIENELIDIMNKKGYTSINDFYGKLKPHNSKCTSKNIFQTVKKSIEIQIEKNVTKPLLIFGFDMITILTIVVVLLSAIIFGLLDKLNKK